MKRQGRSIFYVLIAVLSLTNCVRSSSVSISTLQEVTRIASNQTSREYALLSSFDPKSSKGNIVVFDNEQRSSALASYLAVADLHDNFNGSAKVDILPDFAGENILAVYDNGNSPYSALLAKPEELRTAAVKSMMTSVDTIASAKLTILSSPMMAAFGASDIDTLLSSTGSSFPVLFPVLLAAEQEKQASMICVVGDTEAVEAGVYEKIFGQERVHIMQLDSSFDQIDAFIDYDVIILDDYSFEPGSFKFGNTRVVDTREIVAREVYRIMRKNNTFTHSVSYPSYSALRTDFRGDYSLYDVQD